VGHRSTLEQSCAQFARGLVATPPLHVPCRGRCCCCCSNLQPLCVYSYSATRSPTSLGEFSNVLRRLSHHSVSAIARINVIARSLFQETASYRYFLCASFKNLFFYPSSFSDDCQPTFSNLSLIHDVPLAPTKQVFNEFSVIIIKVNNVSP